LLFQHKKQNNADVRWTWRFKSRVEDGNGENNDSRNGDACPDFLCVGAKKGGTSWLYHQLTLHPDFWMPSVKELRYFDSLSRVKRAIPPRCNDERDHCFLERITALSARCYIDLDGYSRLFEPKGSLLSGDITPAYSMLNDELIERIAIRFANLKVIFLVRDPVDRAWSHLSMGVRDGNISPFDSTDADEAIRNLLNPEVFLCSYPSKTVARWKRYVRPDLFRVYFFEDLKRDPAGLRRSILRFLGADPRKPSGRLSADYNGQGGREKLRLTDKVRLALAKFFKKELKACAAELGGPARHWPGRYGLCLLLFFCEQAEYLDLFL
jgi:hypothetical protein